MTGLASIFATHARTPQHPSHNGQDCCICGNAYGELEFLGYDEVLGEQWIHPRCESGVRASLAKKRHKEEMDAARQWRSL